VLRHQQHHGSTAGRRAQVPQQRRLVRVALARRERDACLRACDAARRRRLAPGSHRVFARGYYRATARPVPTAGGYPGKPATRSTFMGVTRALDLNSLRALADSSFFPRTRA